MSERFTENEQMADMISVETAEHLGYLTNTKAQMPGQKGKLEIPLVCTSKEARNYMKSLPADKARRAGAIALLRGAIIKRQYNTMKRLAYGLSALLISSSALSWYLLWQNQKQSDTDYRLLQQTVSALPKEQIQYARAVYANSIINTMQQNPDMGVLEATKSAVQSVGDNMLPSVKRVISNDVMAMAKAYEDMGVSKDNYHNVMVGYAKNVINAYANHTTSQETVKNNILYYLQSAHMR